MLLWAMVGIPRGSGAALPTTGRDTSRHWDHLSADDCLAFCGSYILLLLCTEKSRGTSVLFTNLTSEPEHVNKHSSLGLECH